MIKLDDCCFIFIIQLFSYLCIFLSTYLTSQEPFGSLHLWRLKFSSFWMLKFVQTTFLGKKFPINAPSLFEDFKVQTGAKLNELPILQRLKLCSSNPFTYLPNLLKSLPIFMHYTIWSLLDIFLNSCTYWFFSCTNKM